MPEAAVHDQPRDAPEVIAVEMRQGHGGDGRRVESLTLESLKGRRATVDEQRLAPALEVEAGVQAPAAAKRIATSQKAHPNGHEADLTGGRAARRQWTDGRRDVTAGLPWSIMIVMRWRRRQLPWLLGLFTVLAGPSWAAGLAGSATPARGQTLPGTQCPAFPSDNVWNTPVTGLPVDSHS